MRLLNTTLFVSTLLITLILSSCGTSNFSRSKTKGIRKVRIEEHVSTVEPKKERTYSALSEKKNSTKETPRKKEESPSINEEITLEPSTELESESPVRSSYTPILADAPIGQRTTVDSQEKIAPEQPKKVVVMEDDKPGAGFWLFFGTYFLAAFLFALLGYLLFSEFWIALLLFGILAIPAIIFILILKNKPRRTRIIGMGAFVLLVLAGIIAIAAIG